MRIIKYFEFEKESNRIIKNKFNFLFEFLFWDKEDKSKQIFPFAQTGSGDWYGFCFSMKAEHEAADQVNGARSGQCQNTDKISEQEMNEIYVKQTGFIKLNEEFYCGI